MANVAYVRVSSAEQHEDRQREALSKYNIDEWFEEKISGKDMDRPQLQECLKYVRRGDTLYVLDFSRLARSTKDLLSIVDFLQGKEVSLVSLKENLDSSTPTGKLMLTMIAAINEFERANILERQAEGIALAKEKGVYKGRKRITIDDLKDFDRLYQMYMNRELSKASLAKKLKISRPTVDRLIEEYRERETSDGEGADQIA